MANFTMEQYNALIEAIASGAASVTYSGKTVSYRSLLEMKQLARVMAVSLGLQKPSYSSRLSYKSPRV